MDDAQHANKTKPDVIAKDKKASDTDNKASDGPQAKSAIGFWLHQNT